MAKFLLIRSTKPTFKQLVVEYTYRLHAKIDDNFANNKCTCPELQKV